MRKPSVYTLAFIVTCLLRPSTASFAQSDFASSGAKAWGIGNATVATTGASSSWTNIAGTAGVDKISCLTAYDNHYGFGGLHTMSVGAVVPFNDDLAGSVTVQRFGDKLYQDLNAGLGVAHRISWVALGLRLNYRQTAINGTNFSTSRHALVAEMGGIATLGNGWRLGAHLYNLTQSSFSGPFPSREETRVRLGSSYEMEKILQVSMEVEKNTASPVCVKVGLAYRLFDLLWLRGGINTRPVSNHFGTGFSKKVFGFDYAAHRNQHLGWAHHLSLSYSFTSK